MVSKSFFDKPILCISSLFFLRSPAGPFFAFTAKPEMHISEGPYFWHSTDERRIRKNAQLTVEVWTWVLRHRSQRCYHLSYLYCGEINFRDALFLTQDQARAAKAKNWALKWLECQLKEAQAQPRLKIERQSFARAQACSNSDSEFYLLARARLSNFDAKGFTSLTFFLS